jgi:hypothetical protein
MKEGIKGESRQGDFMDYSNILKLLFNICVFFSQKNEILGQNILFLFFTFLILVKFRTEKTLCSSSCVISSIVFLSSILSCSHTCSHSQEELTKFGYKSERKS